MRTIYVARAFFWLFSTLSEQDASWTHFRMVLTGLGMDWDDTIYPFVFLTLSCIGFQTAIPSYLEFCSCMRYHGRQDTPVSRHLDPASASSILHISIRVHIHTLCLFSPVTLTQLFTHHTASLAISSSSFSANPTEMRRKSRRCSKYRRTYLQVALANDRGVGSMHCRRG
jgi:hypothetical protein